MGMKYGYPLTTAPYLLTLLLIKFVIRRIPVPELKSVIIKGEMLPIKAIGQVNVESIFRNIVGFTESAIWLPELVGKTVEYLTRTPLLSERALASPEIKDNITHPSIHRTN